MLCAFVFLLMVLTPLSAQKLADISGEVVDANSRQPIESVSIQLLRDSTIILSSITNGKGKFKLQKLTPGNYILSCTFIGYEKQILQVALNDKKVDLGIIAISSFTKEMKSVDITNKKSVLSASVDRKVYNVGLDVMSAGGSASDILKNIPSVEVDIDGNISLRGSSEVLILINGKTSPQMGRSRAEVLQQLSANSIERFEVITNPSAKYYPDGSAGIINIVMKKNTTIGLNSTVTINAGNKDRYNGNVSINYKSGEMNYYGNYAIRQDNRTRLNTINRQMLDSLSMPAGTYFEKYVSTSKPLSHKATIGIEYSPNIKNTFGTSANYVYRFMKKEDVVSKYFYDNIQQLSQQYDRLRYDPETEIEKDLNIFWHHNFMKEGNDINFSYNRSWQYELEDNKYANLYNFPASNSTKDNTLIEHSNYQDHLAIDYANQLSTNTKIELGYDGTFVFQKPVYYVENFDPVTQVFVKDQIKSNNFIYDQSVNALYGTYQHRSGKFSYQGGLRFEQSRTDANLVTKDSVINADFFKIYPTAHLTYSLKTGSLQLNYSKRINRPSAEELNPFPEYRDPRNQRSGNPALLPEIINSLEFGYKYQNKKITFVPSIYYRHKQNGFTEVVTKLNDSTLLTTTQNLTSDQSAGLELIFSAKPSGFFNCNINANFFYNTIDGSALGFAPDRSVLTMSANLTTAINITHTTSFQISSIYKSARLTPQGKLAPTFVLNSGIRQHLFNKRVCLTLAGSDILGTLTQMSELNTPFLNQVIMSRRDAHIFYFGAFIYLGKIPKKSSDEKMQFDNSL